MFLISCSSQAEGKKQRYCYHLILTVTYKVFKKASGNTFFSTHQTGNSDCRASQSPESPPHEVRELGMEKSLCRPNGMKSAQLGQVLTCSQVLRNSFLIYGGFVMYNYLPLPPCSKSPTPGFMGS